jgi:O-methyltransferase
MSPIPDAQFYQPLFSPWQGYGEFAQYYSVARDYTLVSPDRCYVLYQLARQAMNLPGVWYEAGVYRGGTAALLVRLIAAHRRSDLLVRLFDTFEGMPATDSEFDRVSQGEFGDTSIAYVTQLLEWAAGDVSFVRIHKGLIPESFSGLEDDSISFAHVDVDLYASVLACCRFIYPRLIKGGFIVFDDYGFPTCPGARKAVDEYFGDTASYPLVLPTGQAIVFKS